MGQRVPRSIAATRGIRYPVSAHDTTGGGAMGRGSEEERGVGVERETNNETETRRERESSLDKQ